MVSPATSKRSMCPSCSKPARLCLCIRLKTPSIENSIGVTIFQHSLEKKHPLNSTRIASLGLRNLNVLSVSDVNFEAQFVIRFLHPDLYPDFGMGSEVKSTRLCGIQSHTNLNFDHIDMFNSQCGSVVNSEREKYPEEENTSLIDSNGKSDFKSDFDSSLIYQSCRDDTDFNRNSEPLTNKTFISEAERGLLINESMGAEGNDWEMVSDCHAFDEVMLDVKTEVDYENKLSQQCLDQTGSVLRGIDEPAITFTMAKYGVISSLTHHWMPQIQRQKPNFDQLLVCPVALDALSKGFVVKKLRKKQLNDSIECEEHEEFEITVPPGSVLLFPSDKSVGFDGLDFEVKNMIVLDGTWAKAKRMYNENPWLKVLPHLKLDLEKVSLYSEVRHQPQHGCLSTIESIVYALKAIGGDPEGLDDLLVVFESMVGDQRRCKDERLSKISRVTIKRNGKIKSNSKEEVDGQIPIET